VGLATILFGHKNMCLVHTKRRLDIGSCHGLVGLNIVWTQYCLDKKIHILDNQKGVWRLVAIMALWDGPRYCMGTKTCVLDPQKCDQRLVVIMALWNWPRYSVGTKTCVLGTQQGDQRLVDIMTLWD